MCISYFIFSIFFNLQNIYLIHFLTNLSLHVSILLHLINFVKQKIHCMYLWFISPTDCSCLHFTERNATQWGRLAINGSQALGAKNNCLMVFIGGMDDELVAFQLERLQLRPGWVTILPAKFRDWFSGGLGEERLDLESADSCQRQPSKSMDKAHPVGLKSHL